MPNPVRKKVGELAIGDKIRQMRRNKGLLVQELSEKSGLSKALISHLERESAGKAANQGHKH